MARCFVKEQTPRSQRHQLQLPERKHSERLDLQLRHSTVVAVAVGIAFVATLAVVARKGVS